MNGNEQANPLILIVDDDDNARDAYDRFLSSNGCRVAVAADGEEGLRKTASLQPDLIVMDLSIPKLNGGDVIQALRSSKKTEDIPILVLTAHARKGSETVRNMNCEGFLIKPCLPSELLTEVRRVLDLCKTAQHNRRGLNNIMRFGCR